MRSYFPEAAAIRRELVHRWRDPALAEIADAAEELDALMMPVGVGLNVNASGNEMPTYEKYWEPYGITVNSSSAVTFPTAAGAGALVPGALMSFAAAGVGSYPPLGFGAATNQGGDWGSSGNPTFPNNWTVATVDLSAVSATTAIAGVLLGVGAPGAPAPVVPNTISGPTTGPPSLIAMVARLGLVQVLVDNTTTVLHTVKVSTTSTHTGQASDTGGTTYTFGTTIGVALQAVTISAGPLPCWIKLLPVI
jgi:hypothetical protein